MTKNTKRQHSKWTNTHYVLLALFNECNEIESIFAKQLIQCVYLNHPSMKKIVSSFFTGQIMKHNWIKFYGMANRVCLPEQLFNDQNFPNLTQ